MPVGPTWCFRDGLGTEQSTDLGSAGKENTSAQGNQEQGCEFAGH